MNLKLFLFLNIVSLTTEFLIPKHIKATQKIYSNKNSDFNDDDNEFGNEIDNVFTSCYS